MADLPHDPPARTAGEARQRGRGVQVTGRRDGGIDRYRLTLAEGRCRTSRHDGPPAFTLELGPVAFLRLVSGTASPTGLLLTGKLKLRGGLLLALDLPTTLRIPRRRPRRGSASAEPRLNRASERSRHGAREYLSGRAAIP